MSAANASKPLFGQNQAAEFTVPAASTKTNSNAIPAASMGSYNTTPASYAVTSSSKAYANHKVELIRGGAAKLDFAAAKDLGNVGSVSNILDTGAATSATTQTEHAVTDDR